MDSSDTRPLRVLIASHGHPHVQSGGSEVASYALFERLRGRRDVKAWYCGCSRSTSYARAGQAITQPFAPDEFLYTVGDFEWFKFANRDRAFAREFRLLLQDLQPDIVHFHHYLNFGMEAFAHVAEMLPQARILLTLHEFLAICHQQGQMVTRPQHRLCCRSGPVACSGCFPELEASDFFLRETFIRRFLDHVHHFIAPSRFLARRYAEWGIPEQRITVIENVPAGPAPHGVIPAPAPAAPASPTLRIGFFGQISVLKGIQVLIEAAAMLERQARHDIVFSIHGDPGGQPDAFQVEFLAQTRQFGPNIAFHGPYLNTQVDALMGGVDVVLVPSIWWENSPVVIQEAFRNGRPVICPGIGGMAEKVVDGETGLHVQVGSAASLVATLKRLADDPPLLRRLTERAAHRHQADSTRDHLRLYKMTGRTMHRELVSP